MFEVGKQVWFVNTNNPGIKLFLVTEEIVKRSLDGESREYAFQGTHQDKPKKYLSQNLTGEFFISSKDAFKFMHNQAATAIERMLESAKEKYDSVYNNQASQTNQAQPEAENTSVESPIPLPALSEDLIVELPDGTKARMKGGIRG
jgi:hypothetical protein